MDNKTNKEIALQLAGLQHIDHEVRFTQAHKCEVYDKCIEAMNTKDKEFVGFLTNLFNLNTVHQIFKNIGNKLTSITGTDEFNVACEDQHHIGQSVYVVTKDCGEVNLEAGIREMTVTEMITQERTTLVEGSTSLETSVERFFSVGGLSMYAPDDLSRNKVQDSYGNKYIGFNISSDYIIFDSKEEADAFLMNELKHRYKKNRLFNFL